MIRIRSLSFIPIPDPGSATLVDNIFFLQKTEGGGEDAGGGEPPAKRKRSKKKKKKPGNEEEKTIDTTGFTILGDTTEASKKKVQLEPLDSDLQIGGEIFLL
jgi:hypothetical protein